MEESKEPDKKAKTEEPFYPDCVDSLEKLIENVKVEEAGAMYLRLHSTKVEVPSSILNQLLGLLAFSRCSSEELKGLAQRPSLVLPTVRRYPKDIQLLIDVFKTIETPTADHHSIMIRAYVSSGASKEAIDLYNNIVSKNLAVDVDTFNHVLHALAFLTSNPRVKLDVLYYMRKHNVQPNHATFANLITALRYHKDETSLVRQWSKVVNEMMALKMEPGLSIYITMMTAVEKTRLPPKTKQNLHHFILDAIEGKSFKVVSDLDYFAPTVLSNLVKNDLELSKKAFRLMNKAPNSKLFVNWKMQSIFLSKILDVVVNQDRIENSWELISSVSYTHAISINMYNSRLIKAAVRDERPEYIPIFCALRVGFERFEHMASCLSAAIKLFPHADKDTVTQFKNMTEYCLNKAMTCKKQEIFNAIINHCIQLAALSADVTVLLNTVQMVLQKHRSAVIRVESVTMCEDFATTVGNAGLIKRVQLLREMFESQEKVPEDNNRKLNEKRKK
uniref:Small ribosomal subunit protein mS39 n=1 Tax=Ciona savignyi TaxID=51511 RepID=H2YVD9_CIOSA